MKANPLIGLLITGLIILVGVIIIKLVLMIYSKMERKIKEVKEQLVLYIKKMIIQFWEFLKNYVNIPKDKSEKEEKRLFTMLLFIISFLLNVIYIIMPEIDIIKSNYELKNALLFIILVVIIIPIYFIGWIIERVEYRRKVALFLILFFCLFSIHKFKSSTIIIIMFIIIFVVFLFNSQILSKDWKKPNFWVLWTIVIICFVFFAGIVLINSLYGYRQVSLYLNIDGNPANRYASDGKLTCNPIYTNKIFVDSKVKCEITSSSAS